MQIGKCPFHAESPLPQLRGIFVTGTDTEVGKTMIAGAIARELRRGGQRVAVFKPAASGCRRGRGELLSADAEFLAACADSPQPLSEITPVRYGLSLAPNVAARHEDRPVDLDAIFDAYSRLEGQADTVVVEGVGGLLCPISDDVWVVHLAQMLRLPVVIVARAGLGTINHTLLTLHAARSAGLSVAGVVINRYPPDLQMDPTAQYPACEDADLSILTNPEQIAQRGQVPILAVVPDDSESSVEEATIGPGVGMAMSQVDWQAVVDSRIPIRPRDDGQGAD